MDEEECSKNGWILCRGGEMGTGWPSQTSPRVPLDIVLPFEPHGWLPVRRLQTGELSWAPAAGGSELRGGARGVQAGCRISTGTALLTLTFLAGAF